MHPDLKLSICIINGYPKSSRDKLDAADVAQAHDLYIAFLKKYVPSAQIDLLFIADLGTTLPGGANLTSYDGYIWTGSDLTIYHHDEPRVTRQIEFSQALYEAGPPQYGSCWGVQMAAVAAGGEVKHNPKGREWGVAPAIRQTEAGRHSLLLKGKPAQFSGFVMHLDEVTRVPADGQLLAVGEHAHVQALAVTHGKGTFWATQYHPEYNLYEMARLIAARAQPLVNEGFFPDVEAVMAHVADLKALHNDPSNPALREKLGIDDTILDDHIRQQELRNWIDELVIPTRRK